jgi:preprotein translocase subunit SecE
MPVSLTGVKAKSTRVLVSNKEKKKLSYLQEFKDELKKVSWTSKEELRVCAKIVIGAIFLFGLGIYIIDLLIRFTLNGIESIARMIFG